MGGKPNPRGQDSSLLPSVLDSDLDLGLDGFLFISGGKNPHLLLQKSASCLRRGEGADMG